MTTSNQQRQELHKTIWAVAEDLRNSVDGWDFKQYVLGMLFYRFISENITNYINNLQRAAGDETFDYASFPDEDAESAREQLVMEKGFFILPSELFCNVRKNAKTDANLNETLQQVFTNIEASAKGTESEDDLKGLFDDIDVNSNKLGATVVKRNEMLCKILDKIGSLDLKGDYADNQIDVFGDAYEFLMTMYASNAGKSGGEFFTPQEVSNLLARIVTVGKTEVRKVYDPACGSGSLLLQFAKLLGKENIRVGFFGQEINITTYNLCRINMFLHDIEYDKFDIALNGRFRYNKVNNDKQEGSNRETFDYTLSGDTHIRLPWDIEVSTDISWRIREGYSGNAGRDECLWNVQISKRFLKRKKAMIRLRIFDILQQQNNQTRSVRANGITDTTSNMLTSYCILNFTYRFNTLGGREGKHRRAR